MLLFLLLFWDHWTDIFQLSGFYRKGFVLSSVQGLSRDCPSYSGSSLNRFSSQQSTRVAQVLKIFFNLGLHQAVEW